MPIARQTQQDETPKNLRPFLFHGLDLNWRGKSQATGDCPFCGKEGKFCVSPDTGLWDCKVCGISGNPLTFLRELYHASQQKTQEEELADLVEDRGILNAATLERWGATKSFLSGEWLLPGYAKENSIGQVYRWSTNPSTGEKRLFATSGFGHCLYGVHLYDPDKPVVYLCEGPWDAVALWEVLRVAQREDRGELSVCGSETLSLLSEANVLATPSCKSFRPEWLPFFQGKHVVLLFDNDHPRTNNGSVFRDGWDGMRKVYGMLAAGVAEQVTAIRWGEEGYDRSLPSGYDVRDWLKEGTELSAKVKRLEQLLQKVKPVPSDWEASVNRSGTGSLLSPMDCSSWKTLIEACKAAWKWTDGQDHALSVMLSVCISTEQIGDQLFLQVIGDAGSGKTQLCDGLLVSQFCHPVESVKGFVSGWRANEGKDFSLLTRINMKTAITPEGDVMISSPEFAQLMSQQRRMFDGSFTQSYKTLEEDRRYTGLRTPWIMAGTLTLLSADQSRLGDRFLKVFIPRPTEDEESDILDQVFHTAQIAVKQRSNGLAESTKEERLVKVQRLIGGYVDHLRNNVDQLLASIKVNVDLVRPVIKACARFVADLRARPDSNRFKEEKHDTKEMPTRLTHQFTRLAICLAAVLGKKEVDEEVLTRVRRVALDTAYGQTLNIVRHLYRVGRKGLEQSSITSWTGHSEEREEKLLTFLKKIDVVEPFRLAEHQGLSAHVRWRLTKRSNELCSVVGLAKEVK